MPEIKVQHQCAQLTDFVDADSFGEPVGALPKQVDNGFLDIMARPKGSWVLAD